MFNDEYVSKVMNLYGCNQIAVDRSGKCFAMTPERQIEIPGFVFDTTTMDGTLAAEAIAKAKGE